MKSDKVILTLKKIFTPQTFKNLVAVYLFGSYAEELQNLKFKITNLNSDLDIAVLWKKKKNEKIENKIYKEILSKIPVKEIDIISLNTAPLYWKYVAVSGLLVASFNENKRVEFEVYARTRYWDFEYYENFYYKNTLQAIKEGNYVYSKKESLYEIKQIEELFRKSKEV